MKYFVIVIYSLPVLYFVYSIVVYFRTGVPFVPTQKKYFPIIFSHLTITSDTNICDLGCGDGRFLFAAEKFKPNKLIGYELSPLLIFYGKLKARILRSKVKLFCKDFFSADISDADIIYLFLVQPVLDEVWKKIKQEAKRGAIILTLADRLSGEQPIKIFLLKSTKQKNIYMFVYRIQ